jgi:hypothetical protein
LLVGSIVISASAVSGTCLTQTIMFIFFLFLVCLGYRVERNSFFDVFNFVECVRLGKPNIIGELLK